MKHRFRVVLMAALIGLGVVVGVQPAAAQEVTCNSGFGAKVPVLMVHGWLSGPEMWTDKGSLADALNDVNAIQVIPPFNYHDSHDQWVTDSRIGPKLAATIDCLAQTSLKGGGKGKVIVIAHSMGGLATRFAVSQTVNGRKVADEIGHVITLGVPHLGSLWANLGTELATSACQGAVAELTFNPLLGLMMSKDQCLLNFAIKGLSKDSKELKELPPFPPSISVRAVAGDAFAKVPLLFTELTVNTNGDLQVGKGSASAEYTNNSSGGGLFAYRCQLQSGNGPCTHNELQKSTDVQADVKKSIEQYLASIRTPAVPTTNFFGLGLQLGPEWEVLKAKDDPYEKDRKIVVSKASCGPKRDPRMWCSGFVVANMRAAEPKLPYKAGVACNYNQVIDDLGWSAPKVIGKVTVGGVEGEHFTQENVCKLEDGERIQRKGDILHGWRFPSKGVLVYDSEDFDSATPNPFPGVEQLLQTATWK
jgi:pimeloyl-ACP methyl ester carboxylesterase